MKFICIPIFKVISLIVYKRLTFNITNIWTSKNIEFPYYIHLERKLSISFLRLNSDVFLNRLQNGCVIWCSYNFSWSIDTKSLCISSKEPVKILYPSRASNKSWKRSWKILSRLLETWAELKLMLFFFFHRQK